MHIPRFVLVAAAMLAATMPTYALAQVESTPLPAPKKPNFSPMSFMVGTWTCSTKSARRPAAYVTTSTYTLDPSGWWMNETSTTSPTKWIPTKLTTMDRITYDSDTHRWVDMAMGPLNGYALAFSSGWNGDQMTWHDVSFMGGPDISAQSDNVVTKVSNTKMTSSSSFTEAKTGRHVSVTGVCTKH